MSTSDRVSRAEQSDERWGGGEVERWKVRWPTNIDGC
jgi:hypothetical protein